MLKMGLLKSVLEPIDKKKSWQVSHGNVNDMVKGKILVLTCPRENQGMALAVSQHVTQQGWGTSGPSSLSALLSSHQPI